MTTNKDIEIVRDLLNQCYRSIDSEINWVYLETLEYAKNSLDRIESALAERDGGIVFSGNDTIVPPKGEKE